MNINYTGQLRAARKLMFTHYNMKPEDVALMSDDDIKKKIEGDFYSLEEQNENDIGCNPETIYLIPKEEFVLNKSIICLER